MYILKGLRSVAEEEKIGQVCFVLYLFWNDFVDFT